MFRQFYVVLLLLPLLHPKMRGHTTETEKENKTTKNAPVLPRGKPHARLRKPLREGSREHLMLKPQRTEHNVPHGAVFSLQFTHHRHALAGRSDRGVDEQPSPLGFV